MFERTFTFWRRLVGKQPAKSAEAQDDRRLWVRYPADLTTQVRPHEEPHAQQVAARIRDISRGGANLLLDRSFEEGEMISLELPDTNGGTFEVLGCAVRCSEESAGVFSLGCVFSRELTDDDLMRLGARRVRTAPEDQRTWLRFDCDLQGKFHKVGDPNLKTYVARIINISANGVGLLVEDHIEAGALLNVELLARDGHTVRTILACAVHVADKGAGAYGVGCNFIRELPEADIKQLV
ncbi:MAG: PilZ domain-containing protein [Gemmataceae bacterium]|nr:PilZ domain-containing protein [Gemmataceae bacterium]